MAIVGHIVPLVRCRTHRPLLNLAFDGRIYESTPAWETMLTNTIDPQSISIARIFAAPQASVSSGGARKNYPQRDPKTRAQLLDLTAFFNAGLTDSWHGNENSTGNELGGVTAGVQLLEGVEYDVRGIIQLGSK